MTSPNRFVRLLDRNDLGLGIVTAAVSSLLTYVALQLWRADLSVPLTYRGDALPVGAHFKTVRETGWYEYQPLLGAPAGQTYHDFPTADNLHMIAARLLGFVTPGWAPAMNIYFLLGFPLAALAALWFLRRCGISPWVASAFATLYALAPYHFLRGESHLFLASYYVVPLAAVLLLDVVRGNPLWGWSSARRGILRFVFARTTRTVLVIALLGTASSYYSVFFLALLAPTAIIVLVRDRAWRRFWGATAAGVATAVVMLVNMLPDLVYSWAEGANPAGLERSPGESEFYALKFAQLVLPWPGHRIGLLALLRQSYDTAYVSLGEQPALGVVASAGFIAAFVILLALALMRVRASAPIRDPRVGLLAGLSALILGAFLYSTLGGLSTLISVLTSSLRGWNRMSIVIAILSLAVAGLLLDLALSRLRQPSTSSRRSVLAGVVAIALLAVGFLDQTPGDADREYSANAAAFARDAAYFSDLETRLPDDAMVLVLPNVPFPESSADTGLLASDQLVPYLHSDTIRWSSGGIKGRPTGDWPGTLMAYGDASVALLAATAGFDGVLVDRPASADRGEALESALAHATGQSPIASEDARYAFFDLGDLVCRVGSGSAAGQLSELITDPVIAYGSPDFHRVGETTSLDPLESSNAEARFSIVNDLDTARAVVVTFDVIADAGSSVRLTLPDGSVVRGTATNGALTVELELRAEPGASTVLVEVTRTDGSAVDNVQMTPPVTRQSRLVDYVSAAG